MYNYDVLHVLFITLRCVYPEFKQTMPLQPLHRERGRGRGGGGWAEGWGERDELLA